MAEQRDYSAAISILESLRAQGCDLSTAISRLRVAQRRAKPENAATFATEQIAAPSREDDARDVVELAARVGLKGFAKPQSGQQPPDTDVIASLRALGVIGDEEEGQ